MQSKPVIPSWLIWIQSIAFVVLYAVWILPEIVGVRNTALVVGALTGLYPIYLHRSQLLTKRAIPIWLIVTLFLWATFHLLFLSTDYPAQFLEFKRIWKYAAIGSIFAFGLGISLICANARNDYDINSARQKIAPYWAIIYFGLCTPVLIYLLKYLLSTYGVAFGLDVPTYLRIYFGSTPRYYVPKTDYVAFCLPALAIALGQIEDLLRGQQRLVFRDYCWLGIHIGVISGTLFLFYVQDIKNGMAYATICFALFALAILLKKSHPPFWKKILWVGLCISILAFSLYPHIKKNESWRTLIADTKIAMQTYQYQHWKYSGSLGYPNNEYGKMVSITNYERAAWLKIGSQLAIQNPLGYGLIEDSFKKIAKQRWSEVSPNLSHSHSGWLDLVLAVGFPGFLLIIVAIGLLIRQSYKSMSNWDSMIFWALVSQVLLWITTEVSATVTFAALIFWVCWAAGLMKCQKGKYERNLRLGTMQQ